MKTNDDYICLVLGETGVGKSSFINAITNSNNCEVGDEGKACTVKLKISKANIGYSQFTFIDTPGLNDAKGDENNINEIKNGLSEYPNFRCILLLLKFQDTRLNNTTLNILQIFMKCFPTRKFWDHVFIVRTHAEKIGRSFLQTKKKLEGEIVNCINNYDDFKNFKNFMIKENIELPQKIDEYFVDNIKDAPDNFEYNEEEFNKIFGKIKNTKPMFKKIKKVDSENKEENGPFTEKQKWRNIAFIDYEGNEINANPYLSTEDEAPNLKLLRTKKRKEVLETESDCGDVRIKYAYYETKIYEFGGKEICGKECYKGTGWE